MFAVNSDALSPIDASCSDRDGRFLGGSFDDLLKCKGLDGFDGSLDIGCSIFCCIGSFLEYDGIGVFSFFCGNVVFGGCSSIWGGLAFRTSRFLATEPCFGLLPLWMDSIRADGKLGDSRMCECDVRSK